MWQPFSSAAYVGRGGDAAIPGMEPACFIYLPISALLVLTAKRRRGNATSPGGARRLERGLLPCRHAKSRSARQKMVEHTVHSTDGGLWSTYLRTTVSIGGDVLGPPNEQAVKSKPNLVQHAPIRFLRVHRAHGDAPSDMDLQQGVSGSSAELGGATYCPRTKGMSSLPTTHRPL